MVIKIGLDFFWQAYSETKALTFEISSVCDLWWTFGRAPFSTVFLLIGVSESKVSDRFLFLNFPLNFFAKLGLSFILLYFPSGESELPALDSPDGDGFDRGANRTLCLVGSGDGLKF